jgi:predicted nucleic acid-binding protein
VILADTSVWISHLKKMDLHLASLLEAEQILAHPFIIGGIALGNLRNRKQCLHDLALLPVASLASNSEVLEWIEKRGLYNKGIGWVDAHLILSCLLSHSALWTNDKAMAAVAKAGGVSLHAVRS